MAPVPVGHLIVIGYIHGTIVAGYSLKATRYREQHLWKETLSCSIKEYSCAKRICISQLDWLAHLCFQWNYWNFESCFSYRGGAFIQDVVLVFINLYFFFVEVYNSSCFLYCSLCIIKDRTEYHLFLNRMSVSKFFAWSI